MWKRIRHSRHRTGLTEAFLQVWVDYADVSSRDWVGLLLKPHYYLQSSDWNTAGMKGSGQITPYFSICLWAVCTNVHDFTLQHRIVRLSTTTSQSSNMRPPLWIPQMHLGWIQESLDDSHLALNLNTFHVSAMSERGLGRVFCMACCRKQTKKK